MQLDSYSDKALSRLIFWFKALGWVFLGGIPICIFGLLRGLSQSHFPNELRNLILFALLLCIPGTILAFLCQARWQQVRQAPDTLVIRGAMRTQVWLWWYVLTAPILALLFLFVQLW